jgi:hypothetical protein
MKEGSWLYQLEYAIRSMMMMTFDSNGMRLQIALSLLCYQEISEYPISILRERKMLISNLLIVVILSKLLNVIQFFDLLKVYVVPDPHIFQFLQKETVF